MRLIVFLGLAVLVCGVCCRDLRSENPPRYFRLILKDKRGLSDRPLAPPSSVSSYPAPIYSALSSGYSLGGHAPSGISLGHARLQGLSGPIGHGIGYSLAPAGGLGSGYISSGLGHSPLGLQGVSLGGHSAQSTYSMPTVMTITGGSNGLFLPSKTGPVTFSQDGSNAPPSSSPIYATAAQGLSAYSSAGSSLPVMIGSPHGSSYNLPLAASSSPSSYSYPAHSISSGHSYPVTGGLVIATGSRDSSSYSLPISGSPHGISALSGSSGSHGASSAYIPISSGSHGLLSSNAVSSHSETPTSSGSYSSASSHAGISSGLSDSSSAYESPSSSYSSSGSNPYTSYQQDSGTGYSSSSGPSSVTYASPSSSNFVGSSPDYSSVASSASSSYSSPVSYAGTSSYKSAYSSPSSSYGGSSIEQQGAYSSISPRYLGYTAAKSYDTTGSESSKYDTISYSSYNGKY